MNTFESLIVVAVAALIHASFQLSISVLTLLSSHTISTHRSHRKLLSLTGSFAFGAFVTTTLVLSTMAFAAQIFSSQSNFVMTWVILCGLLFGLGIAVWIFYYRKEQGTTLWLPRGLARYLLERTKLTKEPAEAFALGSTSILAELLFILVPIAVAAYALISMPTSVQLAGILFYSILSLLPLFIIIVLVAGGKKISEIQRWREDNKLFLQFIAGSGLIVLGFYLYANEVLVATSFLTTRGLY